MNYYRMTKLSTDGRRYTLLPAPSDHEHDFEPNPLVGDFTCVICNVATSDTWEWKQVPEQVSGGE